MCITLWQWKKEWKKVVLEMEQMPIDMEWRRKNHRPHCVAFGWRVERRGGSRRKKAFSVENDVCISLEVNGVNKIVTAKSKSLQRTLFPSSVGTELDRQILENEIFLFALCSLRKQWLMLLSVCLFCSHTFVCLPNMYCTIKMELSDQWIKNQNISPKLIF